MLSPPGSDKTGGPSQPLLGFRSEMLARERSTMSQSKVTDPKSPEQAKESRFSAFSSISSDGQGLPSAAYPSRSADSFISAMPIKPGRSPNWSDAETRFLITLWGEQYQNISQQRNAKAWDVVARLLNQKLAQCGFETFRSGQQCKGRMKSVVFDYKTTKKRIESGEDDRTCDYFQEIDEVLGKTFVNDGIDAIESGSAVTQEDEKTSNTSGENEESNACDNIVVVNIPASAALSVETTTGFTCFSKEVSQSLPEHGELLEKREPPKKRNKRKASAEEDEDKSMLRFLKNYMEESDKRDREFLLQMTRMDHEREDRNFERTMKMIMEVAKVFKSSVANTPDNLRGSGLSSAPHHQSGDSRFASGYGMGSSRAGDTRETPSNRESRKKANDGSAQDENGKPHQFLRDYMEESDRRDREFFLQMTRLDHEREERSSEQTMRLMLEVAKVFRGGN